MVVAVDTNCILPGKVGGIENYTLALIEALKLPASPCGKIIVITRPENHALFSPLGNERTEVFLLDRPAASWSDLQQSDAAAARKQMAEYQQRKRNELLKRGVNVVHFPGNTINPIELELPIVLNLHDLQHRHFPRYFTTEEVAMREKWWVASANRADALIAGSNFIRDDLVSQLGVDARKIFVTPDVFQAAFFRRPSDEKLRDVRSRYNLPEIFFVYPAAHWPHKNHRRLIAAFARAEIHGAELILTGGGHETLTTGPEMRSLGRISTDDLVGLYHLATALVFPSQYESWSIPIMEAMACGCPVASSNVTSLPEQVGAAGLLFDPTDVSAMAVIMRCLAENPDLRSKLSERGRRRVREFSAEKFISVVARAYEFAIGVHRARKAA